MALADSLSIARSRYLPDRNFQELLQKPWMEVAVPVFLLLALCAVFALTLPGFTSAGNLSDTLRQLGEVGFLTLGMMIVILSGGIDLSVGACYGLTNFATIAALQGLHFPVLGGLGLALLVGGAIGLLNGVLVGVFRMRAFLSTLAVLIICRSIQEALGLRYGASLLSDPGGLDLWYWFGDGDILGLPVSFVVLLVASIATHIVLTRMSLGWHIQAVGGSRKSAFNTGLPIRRTLVICYTFSGLCAGVSGFLYSARTANPGAEVGVGFEIVILTAAIVGGNSLGGGRGSPARALVGSLIVILIVNSLVSLGLRSGAMNFILGLVLLIAVLADVRWAKGRSRAIGRVFLSPAYYRAVTPLASPLGATSGPAPGPTLVDAEAIGPGGVGGPQTLAFDKIGNLYTGSSSGDIVMIVAPHYSERRTFAHIGGRPLGLVGSPTDTTYVCVAGVGIFAVDPAGRVSEIADRAPRSFASVKDDSRLTSAQGLDLAPDGRLFVTESSAYFDVHDWASDSLELRPNGRLLECDPTTGKVRIVRRGLTFPYGVCVEPNGESLLVSETWPCRISRYWFSGSRKGRWERVIDNLPGYVGNITRSSDGHYWVAMLGARTPVQDLIGEMPGFRRRMAQRIAYDEWLYPNLNSGGVLKLSPKGEVLVCAWSRVDDKGMGVTSVHERDGYLYLGSLYNDFVARVRVSDLGPSLDRTAERVHACL